jgi:hypothetical protein
MHGSPSFETRQVLPVPQLFVVQNLLRPQAEPTGSLARQVAGTLPQ